MADMGTKEAAEKWGYTPETVRKWCKEGLIPGVTQDGKGSPYHIPKDAVCPRANKTNYVVEKGGK